MSSNAEELPAPDDLPGEGWDDDDTPLTDAELVESYLYLKTERDRFLQTMKAIEAQIAARMPPGARKGNVGGYAVEWRRSNVFQYEKNPALLRALWDNPTIPSEKKEQALVIAKKNHAALKALAGYSASARQAVESACEPVEERISFVVNVPSHR